MKEGFYSIYFYGETGSWGMGVLVFDTNIVVGADAVGGKYDGTYKFNPATEMIEVDIRVTIPPGVTTVMDKPPEPKEICFPVQVSFPREIPKHEVPVETPLGPASVVIKYLRGFPN